MKSIDFLLERAMFMAKKSECTHKHGAVISKHGEIVAEGYNHVTSYMSHSFTIHAEVDAIQKIKCRGKKYMEDCVLIVLRIGANKSTQGEFRMSKPCPSCSAEIQKCGLRKVFYSI